MNERKDRPWPPVIPTKQIEPPIPDEYLGIDTDLARDNLENDLANDDLQNIYRAPKPQLSLQFKSTEEEP